MLETFWRRRGTLIVVTVSALLLFWLGLRSEGSDWYICETHADILYSAILRFHQFPFFSFAFNGGTYFLQDPQNNLYSPSTLFILLAGPTVGLRLAIALWGGLGCYGFIAWMRRHVDERAAQVGAIAWLASLGVLWRVAVGNDMFLWHLGLPLLFLLVENLLRNRDVRAAIAAGLGFGLFALGPTFHSLMYLVLPTLPVFVAVELLTLRPARSELKTIAAISCVAAAIAIAIASPKLLSWAAFPMRRQTTPDDVIPLGEGLRALVDYGATAWRKVPTIAHYNKTDPWWGVEESVVALPPIATLLAVVGGIVGFRDRRRARLAALGVGFVVMGLVLACTPWLWQLFRTITHGNFRVAPRFLAIAGFGMAIASALGADFVLARVRGARVPLTLALAAVHLGCALWWIHGASLAANRTSNDAVQASAIPVWSRAADERHALARLRSFADLVSFVRGQRRILDGHGYADGFLVVGNDFNPRRWRGPMPRATVEGLPAADVTFGHTRIELRHLAANAAVSVRVIDPRFGYVVRATPPDAAIRVVATGDGLLVTNRGGAAVDRVEIAARLPISFAWLWLSAATILIAALALLRRRKKTGVAVQTGSQVSQAV